MSTHGTDAGIIESPPPLSRRRFIAAAMIAAAMHEGKARAGASSAASTSRNLAAAATGLMQNGENGPTAADFGITRDTVIEAEKIAGVSFTDDERQQILNTIAGMLQSTRDRRQVELPMAVAPMTTFSPLLPGMAIDADEDHVELAERDVMTLPDSDEDIAFAPAFQLSQWLQSGAITSKRLTELYLDRLKRFGPKLECVVTLTEDLAMEQAERADAELQAGSARSPLHGIPWGAKDLFDTTDILTTFGAEPYRERVAESNAVVVQRLHDAGAVLVAKLTLGALAYGDIWFGGRTNNPWNLQRGSSGSSAGSAAATAAGLVGFSLGTETYGSIVSPCMECGTNGLRPTFGRVARTGAMPLCWSLDKIGPICRTVEDCALVLATIHGSDLGDPSSITAPFRYDGSAPQRRLRVGYNPAWFEDKPANDLDRNVLEHVRHLDQRMIDIELPDWPYQALESILIAEAAAAFDDLTLTKADAQLAWQDDEAWPNTFRMTRFLPAVELVQADRFRRLVCEMMAEVFAEVDVIIAPSFASRLLLITNFTGHPSLTIRCGFDEEGLPHGFTLIGKLYDEGTLCRLGYELEQRLAVWDKRPTLD